MQLPHTEVGLGHNVGRRMVAVRSNGSQIRVKWRSNLNGIEVEQQSWPS